MRTAAAIRLPGGQPILEHSAHAARTKGHITTQKAGAASSRRRAQRAQKSANGTSPKHFITPPCRTNKRLLHIGGLLNADTSKQTSENLNNDITEILTQGEDYDAILTPKEKLLPHTYPGKWQRACHQLPGTRLSRKCLSVFLERQIRLAELIRNCWPEKKMQQTQMSAVEIDGMMYAHELD